MSEIIVALSKPVNDIDVIKFLHKELGFSLLDARETLKTGGVIYTCELFMNDHLQKDKVLRNIIEFFRKKRIELFIVEASSRVDWNNIDLKINGRENISDTVLLNILNEIKGHYE
ncbi:TPA: hypothetical protein ACOVFI_004736 [Citrobacter braakii]